jgi:6-pyruvoyltetrahydropterin/6-carboxytetrahydropterin synthase
MICGIRVHREDFNFSAAQILVMNGELEGLSGHNYAMTVDVTGELDSDGAIIDFRVLKQWMKDVVSKYNHKTLVPTNNNDIKVRSEPDRVLIDYRSQIISIPIAHCLMLPLTNTTCEELARQIALELQGRLEESQKRYSHLTVTLYESPGQCAFVQLAA